MQLLLFRQGSIVALRNEKGSYSEMTSTGKGMVIVALRNEKGSYSAPLCAACCRRIVALRNEKGSYSDGWLGKR